MCDAHLNDQQERIIKEKPEKNVKEIHRKGVNLGEKAHRPGSHCPEDETLRERLEKNHVRNHGYP